MSAPIPSTPLARGRTAEVFAWQEGQILKLFYDWCPQQWVQTEIDIGRVIASRAIPIPKLIDSVEIEGRRGIIYERVDGPTMLEVSSVKPWLLFHLARLMAELHTKIHQQDAVGLPSLCESLKSTIEKVDILPSDLKSRSLNLLEKLPDGNTLCHFDFHPGQVILTAKGPVIIDWMTAHQGHPLADVARTSIILKIGQVPGASRTMRVITSLWRGLFFRTYIDRYLELHPGSNRDEITRWMAPVAAARLKEAIPGEQHYLVAFIQANLGK